ncbi:MAG: hypothetical protein ACR2GT_07860 [Gaiellaceae bacterium]
MRALRIGGWANLAIAAAHVIGLISARTFFGWVGIEHEMRELAEQGAALPYILTLITAGFFLVFGLYALSGAGELRRLPLLRPALILIAVIYVLRATLVGGIADVLAGDAKQSVSAAIALLIGLCYAFGAVAHRRQHSAARGAAGWRTGSAISQGDESRA